jgi:hypothetical protein
MFPVRVNIAGVTLCTDVLALTNQQEEETMSHFFYVLHPVVSI